MSLHSRCCGNGSSERSAQGQSRSQPVKIIPSLTDIENAAGLEYSAQATYGFVSGLPDDEVLVYLLKYRDNRIARRVFFSKIDKRPGLSFEMVDPAAQELLDAIEARQDRARNEALLRRLIPRMSHQMRTRTVRTILSVGTKLTRSHVLRYVTPSDAPGISDIVLEFALEHRDQDALVGIIYHWPLDCWRGHIDDLFDAAVECGPGSSGKSSSSRVRSNAFLIGGRSPIRSQSFMFGHDTDIRSARIS
jgi:hypothetical protein